MTIQEQVQQAFKALPYGAKDIPAEVHGCSPVYFRKFTRGEVKSIDEYYLALQSIKQAIVIYNAQVANKSVEIQQIEPVNK